MNKDRVYDMLLYYLSDISYFPALLSDLLGLISGSGYEAQFFKLFVARLRMLSVKGILATELKEFEPLGGGRYSMHLSGTGFNIRILYAFLPNRQPALLCAFHERAGKKNTDYPEHITVAEDRLRILKERF